MDEAAVLTGRETSGRTRRQINAPLALAAWTALVLAAFTWGRSLAAAGAHLAIHAPPLFGRFDARISLRLLPVLAVTVAMVVYLPRLVARAGFRRVLLVCFIAAFAWAMTLAFVDGLDGILGTLERGSDYLAVLPLVEHPLSFLSGFTENVPAFPLHVQAHPPGIALFLWSLDAVGLSGAWWAAVTLVFAGASSTAAALLAVRELAGEEKARACAPFLVVGPSALWIATSADALFLGISAWGIALFVLATGRDGSAGDVLAGAAGLVLGTSLFFSYGVVPLGLIVVTAAAARRRIRPLLVAAGGVALVVATFAALGFSWPAGLGATIERYELGVAARRPYDFFLVNNLAAFAVALGPAVAIALGRLRDPNLWLVVGAALLAVAAANLSGLSKGEVERIWLPFVPWVAAGTAALAGSRGWLALQAGFAVTLATLVRTPW